ARPHPGGYHHLRHTDYVAAHIQMPQPAFSRGNGLHDTGTQPPTMVLILASNGQDGLKGVGYGGLISHENARLIPRAHVRLKLQDAIAIQYLVLHTVVPAQLPSESIALKGRFVRIQMQVSTLNNQVRPAHLTCQGNMPR